MSLHGVPANVGHRRGDMLSLFPGGARAGQKKNRENMPGADTRYRTRGSVVCVFVARDILYT